MEDIENFAGRLFIRFLSNGGGGQGEDNGYDSAAHLPPIVSSLRADPAVAMLPWRRADGIRDTLSLKWVHWRVRSASPCGSRPLPIPNWFIFTTTIGQRRSS